MLLTHDPVFYNQYCAILSQAIFLDSYGAMPAIFPEVNIYHSDVFYLCSLDQSRVYKTSVCAIYAYM